MTNSFSLHYSNDYNKEKRTGIKKGCGQRYLPKEAQWKLHWLVLTVRGEGCLCYRESETLTFDKRKLSNGCYQEGRRSWEITPWILPWIFIFTASYRDCFPSSYIGRLTLLSILLYSNEAKRECQTCFLR